jgi:gamma-glutamylcyclotransferase (GGCT)/AIG2-like uncharacterized protein YtfP
MDVFVYGTLMADNVVLQLTGRAFERHPARLHGYRRVEEPGSYPYILPSAADTVTGSLLREVDGRAMEALDRYEGEGDLYFRVETVAETENGCLPCFTYVGNRDALDRLRHS